MKNVLITGISRGLGYEITKVILESGDSVWGISRSKTKQVENLLNKYPTTFHWKSYDLRYVEHINKELFYDFVNFDVKLHGFVNNAAIAYDDIITNLQLKPLNEMYRVNVFSPMMITKYAIRNMLLRDLLYYRN